MAEESNAATAAIGRVAPEVALDEFERMCEARIVDIDESAMSEEDKESFIDVRKKIVDAIVRGYLTVASDGTPTYTPRRGGDPVTFYEATGATFMAADTAKDGKNVTKMVAMLTDMTRTNKGDLSKLKGYDFKLCMALGQLFLA